MNPLFILKFPLFWYAPTIMWQVAIEEALEAGK